MEPNTNDKKVSHQLYEVQFSDEAIIKLKYNKKTEKRHRVKVILKNGPKGVSLRWTPRTNKKVFQLLFKLRCH